MTSEGGPAGIRPSDTVLTSEGGPDQDTTKQETNTQRKNEVREKWIRKLANRLKPKQKKHRTRGTGEWQKL